MNSGHAAVINGKVYFGGGACDNDENIVCCYDPSQDKWTTLPPLPVKYFGLGQVSGKLVVVGGGKINDLHEETNKVYTYDERSRKWKQTIPPMPTARRFPGILSLPSALIVAGGNTPSLSSLNTDVVEIFKPDTSQWYRTDSLPTDCQSILLVAIGNTCYALGGFKYPMFRLNQALYASVNDLLHNAVPANQTTHCGSSDTQSAWRMLPNTPTYQPAAAVLGGKLLGIGGTKGRAAKKEIYVYSPSTNTWIYISDLPAPRSTTAVAILSSTEVLVIGGWGISGWGEREKVNTVYMGTITFTF